MAIFFVQCVLQSVVNQMGHSLARSGSSILFRTAAQS